MLATDIRANPFVVVSGGSDGIGREIALRFARAGKRVLLVARDQERLERAAEAIRGAGKPGAAGVRVDVLALDITTPGAAELIESHVAGLGGHVETLVQSAGIGLSGGFDTHTPGEIERLLALNVTALTRLMRHYLPGMRARGQGGVINIASLGGYVPGPYQAVYYASKAYVISLSEAVAAEAAADGVRVMVVSPGPVATAFHARMGAERSLYRRLIPAATPASVARWALLAYSLHLRSVAPGVVNTVLVQALRILPHRLVIPIVSWLLRPREREGPNA